MKNNISFKFSDNLNKLIHDIDFLEYQLETLKKAYKECLDLSDKRVLRDRIKTISEALIALKRGLK